MTAMLLGKRLVVRPRGAAEVGNGDGFAVEQRGGCHGADLGMRAQRRNWKQRTAEGRRRRNSLADRHKVG